MTKYAKIDDKTGEVDFENNNYFDDEDDELDDDDEIDPHELNKNNDRNKTILSKFDRLLPFRTSTPISSTIRISSKKDLECTKTVEKFLTPLKEAEMLDEDNCNHSGNDDLVLQTKAIINNCSEDIQNLKNLLNHF